VIWYGGGKLAADLTLPKLGQRWNPRIAPAQPSALQRITAAERNAAYEHAAREARAAAAHIRRCSASDPRRSADAAWAVADVLRIAARVLRDPALRQAADAYDRAARAPYGRISRCTYPGDRLRFVARRLAALGLTLTNAVADLRAGQHHAAQATAARQAAEHLREAVTNRRPRSGPAQVRLRAADVTRMDVPARLTAPRQALRDHNTPRRQPGPKPPARRARPPPS
jgi:hypothetical protein